MRMRYGFSHAFVFTLGVNCYSSRPLALCCGVSSKVLKMATRAEVSAFGVKQVCELLRQKLDHIGDDTISSFEDARIPGSVFVDLTEADLKEIVKPLGERKSINKLILSYQPTRVLDDCTNHSSSASSRSASSWFPSQFTFPRFSNATMSDIQAKTVKRSTRIDIVQSLGHQMWVHTEYPTSAEYTAVCQLLVSKFSALEDSIGNGIGSWKIQLRQWFSNKRKVKKGPVSQALGGDNLDATVEKENVADEASLDANEHSGTSAKRQRTPSSGNDSGYEENLSLLQCELSKEKPKRRVLKKLMLETFEGRRSWIVQDRPPIHEVLDLFSPLKKISFIHRELLSIAEKELSICDPQKLIINATATWEGIVPKIEKLSSSEAEGNATFKKKLDEHMSLKRCTGSSDDTPMDLRHLQAFELLMLLLANKKTSKTIKATYYINAVAFDEEVTKTQVNHPYLAVVEDLGAVQFFLIVERNVLCSSVCFVDALWALIGAYYVFDCVYPKPLESLLLFVQQLIMNIRDSQPLPPVATIEFTVHLVLFLYSLHTIVTV